MPAKQCEPKSAEKTASIGVQLSTAPFDTRFPNQNQTRNCWQNYVDYYRCQKLKGETYAPCEYFKKIFTSMCPKEWVSVWDEQRANDTFAGKI